MKIYHMVGQGDSILLRWQFSNRTSDSIQSQTKKQFSKNRNWEMYFKIYMGCKVFAIAKTAL